MLISSDEWLIIKLYINEESNISLPLTPYIIVFPPSLKSSVRISCLWLLGSSYSPSTALISHGLAVNAYFLIKLVVNTSAGILSNHNFLATRFLVFA